MRKFNILTNLDIKENFTESAFQIFEMRANVTERPSEWLKNPWNKRKFYWSPFELFKNPFNLRKLC